MEDELFCVDTTEFVLLVVLRATGAYLYVTRRLKALGRTPGSRHGRGGVETQLATIAEYGSPQTGPQPGNQTGLSVVAQAFGSGFSSGSA